MKITPRTMYSLQFSYLPAYAKYLFDHKLEDFVLYQYSVAEELGISLLQAFQDMTVDDRNTVLLKYGSAFLESLARNQAESYINDSILQWTTNTLPHIDKHKVESEDLSLITFARKKTLLQFLPEYCRDQEQMISIIEELDYFFTKLNVATTETYIKLLKEKIANHTHLIEKINTASPSAIYVLDVNAQETIYFNEKFLNILECDNIGIDADAFNFFQSLILSNDLPTVHTHYQSLLNIEDKDILSCKYRIKNKDGHYRWMRNYDTVFKRNNDNSVSQVIGVIIDVTKEKTTADELRRREEQLTEAQALAHVGSWSYTLVSKTCRWSNEMYNIYQLDKTTQLNLEFISTFTHPEDLAYSTEQFNKVLESKTSVDFQYRIITADGAIKYIHAKAEVIKDLDDQPVEIFGTVQDITQQQNLIQKLKQSEALYKQAQSLAHIGNWSTDLLTNEITWSDEMFMIYEMPKTNPISIEKWFTMIHPEDRNDVISYWHDRLIDKQQYDKIHKIVLDNGKIKTLHRKGEFILNNNGDAIKVIGTTQDITEQYRIQQELKEKQNFIQKITDAAPSIISSYNVTNDQYVFINQGLQKLLGYAPEEALGKGAAFFTDLVHEDDVLALIQSNNTALQEANNNVAQNKIAELTYRMLHKDGNYKWFTTYATVFDRNHSGQAEHILRISLDVTDHINARKKIEEQELFIQQVADASPTILYLYDTIQNKFTYINQEIFYVLGYTPEEIIQMNDDVIHTLYHPEDIHLLPERPQVDKKFQHSNSMIQYECRLKNKGGEWCWLVIREVIFQKDENGKPIRILGAALDISKRKEMERSLLQNTHQLQQSNSSLEEFAYVASHDLKEPLRKISTFGDRIIQTQHDRLNDDGKLYLKKIVDASQRMQVMINDLLSISMISGDKSFQPYSLQNILEEVKQTLEYKIEKQNAQIDVLHLPEANIVASQFRQLFQNLLSNSLKFTREGIQPKIKITWYFISPDDLDNVQVNKAARYLKLDFSDNGIGFEEEYTGKIFQIFQRLHGRSEYEGTGIGLAICKKIIEHHGGAIYAHGYPGEGAVFTIILPA